MIRSAKRLMLIACLNIGVNSFAYSQTQDTSPDDVMALGAVSVIFVANGKKVILHDETKGDIELILTPSLVQTVDEYPAESFEAEGLLINGQMTVKSLRPIE